MLECKDYSLTEFKQLLKISKRQWEERKDDLLEHLKYYFDYEIIPNGRKCIVRINQQYDEYEPLPRKTKMKEINSFYYQKTKEEVKKSPWNSGSNIARNIIYNDDNMFNHAESTMVNHIRPIIKSNFLSPNADGQWMKISEDRLGYEELTEEQKNFFNKLLGDNVGQKEAIMKIIGELQSGYITRTQAKEKMLNISEKGYFYLMSAFKNEYGFMPVYVKYLQEIQNFDEEN